MNVAFEKDVVQMIFKSNLFLLHFQLLFVVSTCFITLLNRGETPIMMIYFCKKKKNDDETKLIAGEIFHLSVKNKKNPQLSVFFQCHSL